MISEESVQKTIGIAGPVSVAPFRHLLDKSATIPQTFSFPLIGVLARELHSRGYQVVVFAASLEILSPEHFLGDGIELIVCPLRKKRAAYDWWRVERRHLVEAMKSSRCDIIHAHWTYEFAAAAMESGHPHLITAHDSPAAIFSQFLPTRFAPYWTFRTIFGAWVIRRATAMTTVSPYCRDHIRKILHPRCAISVVPNGIESQFTKAGEARLESGVSDGPPVIASVMDGFGRRKNASTALRAFALFRREFPDARYLIFGTSYGEGEEAHRWALAHGLSAGVEFRGRTPQEVMFPELLTRAHLFLHPSVEESFGMAPLEAMALGIPVIGGRNSGGVPYVLNEGNAGLLVDVKSPRAVAAALRSFWLAPLQREEFARRGWNRARTAFSLERMVDSYEAEYRRVLSTQAGSGGGA